MRFVLYRMALAPLVLLAANAAGFLLAATIRAGRPWQSEGGAVRIGSIGHAYGDYLAGALRGDSGLLPRPYDGTVAALIGERLVASLGLLGVALALSVALGVGLALAAVRLEPPGVRGWLAGVGAVGLAMPAFFSASLAISLTIVWIIYGPGEAGRPLLPISGFGWDAHMVLPTLVLLVQPTARIASLVGGLLADELARPHVLVARSFGHRPARIIRRHALRAVLAPAALATAASLRLLVGELVIVERLFDWPGLGQLVALLLVPETGGAARASPLFLDPPLAAALLTVFAALFLLADLLAGLAARAADPRMRA